MFFRSINTIKCLKRSMSRNVFTNMSVDKEGIATLSLNKPPVNIINLEVLEELLSNLDEVERNEYKAVILTSTLPTIFSAGMDLFEFYRPDKQRLVKYWTAVQDFFMKLYASPFISTAAINGYAGAGACVISMTCDYRVMVKSDTARIGLNDTTVGIIPRDWIRELMIRTIGLRQAEMALTSSKMYNVDEALQVNLVDEIACDKEEAIEKCKRYIRLFDNVPKKARIEAKKEIRGSLVKQLEKVKQNDLEGFMENILDPNIQKHLDMYINTLKQRKK